jgi:hypothetical protein
MNHPSSGRVGNVWCTLLVFFLLTKVHSDAPQDVPQEYCIFSTKGIVSDGHRFVTGGDDAVAVGFSGKTIAWNPTDNQVAASSSDAPPVSSNALIPHLTAVVENVDGSTKAVFGYTNSNRVAVSRPVSSENNFICRGNGLSAGQPVNFLPGTAAEAFQVDFTGDNISWTLDGTTVTARKSAAADLESGMWSSDAIGSGVSGNYHINDQTITLTAHGPEGTATRDNCYFVNYTTGSDFSITVKYRPVAAALTAGAAFPARAGSSSKAGVAVRKSVRDNASYCALLVDTEGTVVRECRLSDGEAVTATPVGNVGDTPWLKIDKEGSRVRASVSADGVAWRSVGSEDMNTGSSAMAGLSIVCLRETVATGDAAASFDNVNVNFADNNFNTVPDVVESVIGSSTKGLPRRSDWINEGITTEVADDYSAISGYEHCTDVRTIYGHGRVEGLAFPVDRLVDLASAPVPVNDGCKGCLIDGGKLHNFAGTVRRFESVVQPFPLSSQLRGVPGELLRLDHFNATAGEWEAVPIAFVTPDAVYARVMSYSYYRIATNYVIKKVSTAEQLADALDEAKTGAAAESPYAIVCEGSPSGTFYKGGAGNAAFTVPANVYLIGGVPDVNVADPQAPFISDPGRYKSILTVHDPAVSGPEKQVVLDMQVVVSSGGQMNMHTTISGFTVRGGDDPGSVWSAGGLRIAGFGGPLAYINVNSCTFEKNTGTTAGAMVIANARHVRVERCIFRENRQVPITEFPDVPKNGNAYGASAVLVTSDGYSFTEGAIGNCVFHKNEAFGAKYAGTVTVFGDFTLDGNAASVPQVAGAGHAMCIMTNCTFNRNAAAAAVSATSAGAIVRKNTRYDIVEVVNSIIWDNAPARANGKSFYALDENSIAYSDINNAFTPTAQAGNISIDPEFVDPDDVNGLRLRSSSRCRNVGRDIAQVTDDITGAARRTGVYDMGAYEHRVKILMLGDGSVAPEKNDRYRSLLKKTLEDHGWETDFIEPKANAPAVVPDSADTREDFDIAVMLTSNDMPSDVASFLATVNAKGPDDAAVKNDVTGKTVILKVPAVEPVETAMTGKKAASIDKKNTMVADTAVCFTKEMAASDDAVAREWGEAIGKALQ